MKIIKSPSEAQIATLKTLPKDAPVAALNLFHFNEHAQYVSGDPEYGTPDADITGREAFDRYAATAGACIIDLGGRVVFSTPVVQMMIGPEDAAWDRSNIIYFPSRGALIKVFSNPDVIAASRHRMAALANHRIIHLDGTPFVE